MSDSHWHYDLSISSALLVHSNQRHRHDRTRADRLKFIILGKIGGVKRNWMQPWVQELSHFWHLRINSLDIFLLWGPISKLNNHGFCRNCAFSICTYRILTTRLHMSKHVHRAYNNAQEYGIKWHSPKKNIGVCISSFLDIKSQLWAWDTQWDIELLLLLFD